MLDDDPFETIAMTLFFATAEPAHPQPRRGTRRHGGAETSTTPLPLSKFAPAAVWGALVRELRNDADIMRRSKATLEKRYSALALHELRVVIRRFQVAAKSLEAAKAISMPSALFATLWATRHGLSATRDLDVFMEKVLPKFVEHAGHASRPSHSLRRYLYAQRKHLHSGACQVVHREITGSFERSLDTWLNDVAHRLSETRIPSAGASSHSESDEAMAALIERTFIRADKHAAKLRHCRIRDLHVSRIAIKKLRYLVGMFPEVGHGRHALALQKSLTDIQDELGEAHDLYAGGLLLDAFHGSASDEDFMRKYRQWAHRRIKRHMRAGADCWTSVQEAAHRCLRKPN